MLRVIFTLIAGFIAGVMGGMVGVGGAVISTPAIRLLGASAIASVGSTLPAIIPSAITSSFQYHRSRLIDWRGVKWTAIPGCGFAVVGALLVHAIPGKGHLLMIATAILIGISATQIPRRSRTEEEHAQVTTQPPISKFIVIGISAGLMAGLLGVGGGVLMVPAFASWLRLPIKRSVATSLVCGAVLAVPAMITHWILGNINWAYALPLCVTVVPGALIGSRFTIKAGDLRLRRIIAVLFGCIAIVYGTSETIALFH